MQKFLPPAAAALVILALAGCPPDPSGTDGGPDAGPADAGPTDAGDAGPDGGPDAGPDTVFDATPEPYTAETTATFAFSGVPAADRFECSRDDGPFETCPSPVTVEQLGSGPHRFAVRAVAGEVADATPAVFEWVVDLEAPDTQIVSAPPSFIAETQVTFELSASEAGAVLECELDGAGFEPCGAEVTYADLAEGGHTLLAQAIDRVGNVDPTPARHYFTVDTVAPTTQIDEPYDPGPTATIRFAADETGCTFVCALDRGAFEPCTSPARLQGLAPGEHVFAVQATDRVGNVEAPAASLTFTSREPGEVTVRIAASNVTSGNYQRYEGPGIRILQALTPDIALMQEFSYENSTPADLRAFVDLAFGPEFEYAREGGAQIPNGVVSRFPILESGEWADSQAPNRDFAWARIDIPGPIDLWAVSVHFLTSNAGDRDREAQEVVSYVHQRVPEGDFLVFGGDLNTKSYGEGCFDTLSQIVLTDGPHPEDQRGNPYTDAQRDDPYDFVLVDADLQRYQVDTVVGSSVYPDGLVFDSRVYTPLYEVEPVLHDDSDDFQMQHMLVVKDFRIPE